MAKAITLSSKGQITLPAAIRRQLGVQSGDRLYVEFKQGKAFIQKDSYDEQLSQLRSAARQHLRQRGLENLPLEEIKRRAELAKQKAHGEQHDVCA